MTSINRSISVYKALIDMGSQNDILDPFVKIVSAAIVQLNKPVFSFEEIHSVIEPSWMIPIPEMVLRTILGRIIRSGNIKRQRGKSTLAVLKRDDLGFTLNELKEHKL